MQHQHLFNTLQQVAVNRRLLQVNKALLRVIALSRFIKRYKQRIKGNISDIRPAVLNNIYKISCVLGVKPALKCLQLSYAAYLQMRRKQRCGSSLIDLCRLKHPAQLLKKETEVIKNYCTDSRFVNWPRASVYHKAIRDGAAAFAISTFYKYVSLLNLNRKFACKRRKNHYTGIRANAPLRIIHADLTIFKTADNARNYIYLIQDNFSRAILKYRVAKEYRAQITFENLTEVNDLYLKPSGCETCELITDDCAENYGPVKDLIAGSANPVIRHIIAQRDVEFSNSMIEAANKQIKYHFLYHQHIPDYEALEKHAAAAVEDYNNRPGHVLNGLTPLEVLNGKVIDPAAYRKSITLAKTRRAEENKKAVCCYCSF
jgi:putative transposase